MLTKHSDFSSFVYVFSSRLDWNLEVSAERNSNGSHVTGPSAVQQPYDDGWRVRVEDVIKRVIKGLDGTRGFFEEAENPTGPGSLGEAADATSRGSLSIHSTDGRVSASNLLFHNLISLLLV